MKPVELLAPAGDRDSAYAAFHYGADAIYIGLKKFSARAEATNVTAEELGEIVAFAHAATPRRRVYAAINTLVLDHELGELVDTLGAAEALGADAAIVQDLGAFGLCRRHFPRLPIHGSTQMSVHNLAGAVELRNLGAKRVTLARELTMDEVRDIAARSGIEVEVFIHGALCYSYSGLCLYSSLLRGRSGNRGRCVYPCRDAFSGGRETDTRFPFSMKDLALPAEVGALRDAGAASLKIEGRKKSALYVAVTTHYYRRLLDGALSDPHRREAEEEIKTVFSRPWTTLYAKSRAAKSVRDTEVVGHRGAPVGKVEAVLKKPHGDWLKFRVSRRIEIHDGLQIDIEGEPRPYGFPVDGIRLLLGGGKSGWVFEAPPHSAVEVQLPAGHPEISVGGVIYCSSSQAVKQKYRVQVPKPGAFRVRLPVKIVVKVAPDRLEAEGRVRLGMRDPDSEVSARRSSTLRALQGTKDCRAGMAEGLPAATSDGVLAATATVLGTFTPSRQPELAEAAGRGAFEKLGDTAFELASFAMENPGRLFVPVSLLNRLRRDLTDELDRAVGAARAKRLGEIKAAVTGSCHFRPTEECEVEPTVGREGLGSRNLPAVTRQDENASMDRSVAWALKTDRLSHLDALEDEDFGGMAELVVDIGGDPVDALLPRLEDLRGRMGPGRVRLAIPAIVRAWETAGLGEKIGRFREAGWRTWETANLGGWGLLKSLGAWSAEIGLSTDWSVYVVNRAAARQTFERGSGGFVLSPEDTFENMKRLLGEFGERATVLVYQDTPLFISETCATAAVEGHCLGGESCQSVERQVVSSAGEPVLLIQRQCRTYAVGRTPYCLARRLDVLREAGARRFRADFIIRRYEPAEVRGIWRALRKGEGMRGLEGNFMRGLA